MPAFDHDLVAVLSHQPVPDGLATMPRFLRLQCHGSRRRDRRLHTHHLLHVHKLLDQAKTALEIATDVLMHDGAAGIDTIKS